MSALGSRLQDARVVDLFAGSGALGLEALSRGAREVVFVEKSREALRVLRANLDLLGAGDLARVVQDDALRYVRGLEEGAFDLALADPPYGLGLARQLLEHYQRRPFARELWVEHRTRDGVPDIPGAGKRKYGDTMLTTVSAAHE